MIFLDPMSDIAFKKLFGDQAKPNIVISFLNSILARQEGEKIVTVTITDPFNTPDTEWLKTSIVDVRCVDQSGKNYIIELQVEFQDDYPQRSQYYASLAIARQLKRGGRYNEVMPVIFIAVLDFKLFNDPDYISHFKILNTKTHAHDLKLLEFHFIELPKFNKAIDKLDDVVDKWIYLLKNASELSTIPKQLKSPAALEEALDVLEQGALSDAELRAYDKYVDARRVAESIKMTQQRQEEALRRQMQELERKVEEAQNKVEEAQNKVEEAQNKVEEAQNKVEEAQNKVEEAQNKAKKETQRTIARKLLSTMGLSEIAQITGLSIEEINNFKK